MILPGRVDLTKVSVGWSPPVEPGEPEAPDPLSGWETLTPHPTVMAQPTSRGRTLRTFTPHGDHVLMGYGDYSSNTGPMAVLGYVATTGAPVTLLTDVPTEAIDTIRVIDGVAYAPYIDPTGADAGGFTSDRSGTWSLTTMPDGTMIHAYDVVSLGGKLLICGSIYTNPEHTESAAVVWQEQTNGTWVKVLEEVGPESEVFPRFYEFHFETDPDAATVQFRGNQTFTWSTMDGAAWTRHHDAPNLPWSDFQRPAWALPESATAYCEAGGYAWVGFPEGVVRRAPIPLP